jgi:hypothetical protein
VVALAQADNGIAMPTLHPGIALFSWLRAWGLITLPPINAGRWCKYPATGNGIRLQMLGERFPSLDHRALLVVLDDSPAGAFLDIGHDHY